MPVHSAVFDRTYLVNISSLALMRWEALRVNCSALRCFTLQHRLSAVVDGGTAAKRDA